MACSEVKFTYLYLCLIIRKRRRSCRKTVEGAEETAVREEVRIVFFLFIHSTVSLTTGP
jgi:hypothetical protein